MERNDFKMDLSVYLPFWNKLTENQRNKLSNSVIHKFAQKGAKLHNGLECTGLLIVKSGQLRAYITSDEGREITIYRLFDMDICLFSASCIINSLQFTVNIDAQKDSELYIIPADLYKNLMDTLAPVANYTNELMATKFSEVMWLIEQIMWKSMDKRLAKFLLDESSIENSKNLKVTHEIIANHIGSAREVVTRMLKYFQSEGMVKLTRGTIEIIDIKALQNIFD